MRALQRVLQTRRSNVSGIRRRDLLTGAALLVAGGEVAQGGVTSGHLPWHPAETTAPQPVKPGPWLFFTPAEAAALGAIAHRIIPPDPGAAIYQDLCSACHSAAVQSAVARAAP